MPGESNVVVLFLQSVRICPYTHINLFTVSLHENFNPKHYSQCLWLYCADISGETCVLRHIIFFFDRSRYLSLSSVFRSRSKIYTFHRIDLQIVSWKCVYLNTKKKKHNSLVNIPDVVNAISPFKLMSKSRPHYVFICSSTKRPKYYSPTRGFRVQYSEKVSSKRLFKNFHVICKHWTVVKQQCLYV